MSAAEILVVLDYLGVAVFAVTGALAASRRQLDIMAFIFFGVATGIGGGTLRDILLGQLPVFWIGRPTYLVVAVYFTAHHFYESWSRYRLLLWADAVGLSAYAVMGAAKALAVGAPPIPAVIMGALTATFGGVIRDILAGEPTVLVRQEIYVTAAVAGATVHVVLVGFGLPFWMSAGLAAGTAFGVRAGALVWRWRLPVYKSRPGRDPKDLGGD